MRVSVGKTKVGPFLVAIRTPRRWETEACNVRVRVEVRVRVRVEVRVRVWVRVKGIPVRPQNKLAMQPRWKDKLQAKQLRSSPVDMSHSIRANPIEIEGANMAPTCRA